jgi:hypothetical protein
MNTQAHCAQMAVFHLPKEQTSWFFSTACYAYLIILKYEFKYPAEHFTHSAIFAFSVEL